ncbi:MAG: glutamine-hydrolyzing GMP synthase [Oligoflexales bacterium]
MTYIKGSRPSDHGILICDYGSQYTLLIARKLREIGVYAEVIDGISEETPHDFECIGIILSGGPDSVMESEARLLPEWVLKSEKPVLGICYGMQLLVNALGGKVRLGKKREYGKAHIHATGQFGKEELLASLPARQTVWMSHGDDVELLPEGFAAFAYTEDEVVCGIAHEEMPYLGLQFHPEVLHTEHGSGILKNFVQNLCHYPCDWNAPCMISGLSKQICDTVQDGKVLLAVSGGVDSSVAALLLTKALKVDQVVCVLVDHGLMRKNEVIQVSESLRKLGLKLEVLECSELYFNALAGVTDPEEKRKIIGKLFIEVFEGFAKKGEGYTHLGQGTLYSDVIESAGHGSGAKVIKSHHNVGGLPERLHLHLVEPFRFLFKDEVRVLGKALGLPEVLLNRHPFPGPGLGIRIPGEVTQEKASVLQLADEIFVDCLHDEGYYDKVWQAATILLPVKSVGVMGDNRTYQWTCVLRAVTGTDAMTAKPAELPLSFLEMVASKIVGQVNGINRVLYDVTSKPPATIEWE